MSDLRAHAAPRTASGSTNNLTFHGGTDGVGVVTGAPQVYLVFWGSRWGTQSTDAHGYTTFSGDPSGMAPDLEAFMSGLGRGAETWSGVTTQYCQGVKAGAQTCPAYADHVGYPSGGVVAGIWEDTSSSPLGAYGNELANEAILAANHFGNSTQTANRNAQYVIVSATGSQPDGFPYSNFCAWHDFTGDPNLAYTGPVMSSPFEVAFTNMPYVPDAGANCGANFVNPGAAGTLDGVTIVAGHEYAETLSDQFPVGGWIDSGYAENGDKCAWITAGSGQGAAQDIALTTGGFAVQSLWANDFNAGNGGCEISHPVVVTDKTPVPPVITTPNSDVLVAGLPGTLTVTSTGYPVPSLSETGRLPAGVTFTDNGEGTATLAGTPAIGQAGSYQLAVVAANGAANNFTQTIALTVQAKGGSIFGLAGSPDGKPGLGGDSASSPFHNPGAVAVDRAGNVYVLDSYNNQVRKIDVNGNGSIIAGSPTGLAGNTGDGGAARAATLSTPYGLAVDSAGRVYIADSANNRVRRIDSNGKITDFAGHPDGSPANDGDGGPATSAGLSEPTGVAVDLSGNVYIADDANARVRRVDTAGTITNVAGDSSGIRGDGGDGGPAAKAKLDFPWGVAVDATGNLFIVEEGSGVVRKVDVHGTITTFAGDYFTTAANSGDGGPATSARLLGPDGVAVDAAGNVYIADTLDSRVRMVDITGTITNFAGNVDAIWGNSGDGGPASAAALNNPVGVAVSDSGIVYITDSGNNRVRLVPSGVGAPGITSPNAATFTVGAPHSFKVTVAADPTASLAESGALPSGVTFNKATATLSGTPAQGTAGSYPIAFIAANGVAPDESQGFALTVDQATFTYPVNGQIGVDTTQPFWWTLIPEAQAYVLTIGTTQFGTNLLDVGISWPGNPSYSVPPLPAGPTLYATLYTEINGGWTSYQAITFTAAQVRSTFTFPTNQQAGVDPTRPFTWTTSSQAQGYILVIGTTRYGTDVLKTGPLTSLQSSYLTPILPANKLLYATLLTKVNGSYTGLHSIVFTTGPAMATLTQPLPGQKNVQSPGSFSWTTITGAKSYDLTIGTAPYTTNIVNSGVLPSTQVSRAIPALPHRVTLYATLYTLVNNAWVYEEVVFTTV